MPIKSDRVAGYPMRLLDNQRKGVSNGTTAMKVRKEGEPTVVLSRGCVPTVPYATYLHVTPLTLNGLRNH